MNNFLSQLPDGFDLPKRISRVSELAYNLWWTWNPEATRAFSRLDAELWEGLGHNPIRFLHEIGRRRLNQAAKNKQYVALYDSVFANFDSYMKASQTWTSQNHPELNGRPIAYFSMEFGLHETLPIYSGGLGVLAGDHLKEASDRGLPLVGVGFMYAQGYFSQRITEDGWQEALNNTLDFNNLPAIKVLDDEGNWLCVDVEFPDRTVALGMWEIRVGRVRMVRSGQLAHRIDAHAERRHPLQPVLAALRSERAAGGPIDKHGAVVQGPRRRHAEGRPLEQEPHRHVRSRRTEERQAGLLRLGQEQLGAAYLRRVDAAPRARTVRVADR